MRHPMTESGFLSILTRQRQSGLTIRDFCMNEAYTPSTFYYWKGKFCSQGSRASTVRSEQALSEDFAPVRFPISESVVAPPTAEDSAKQKCPDEIMIALPSGVNIHFRGTCGMKGAMRLISQMYSSHVLPQ